MPETVPFTLGPANSVVASVTSTSGATALVGYSTGRSVVVKNLSYNDVYVVFGDSTAVATNSGASRGYAVMARTAESLTPGGTGVTHAALIMASGLTGEVQLTAGAGA